MEEERKRILELLGRGQISVDDAERLLRALAQPQEEAVPEGAAAAGTQTVAPAVAEPAARATPETVQSAPGEPPASWRRYWIWPLLAGGTVLLIGALIMGLVYATGAAPGWRVCGWLPMIMGLSAMVLAWWSRTATWLHLRISEPGSRRLAISLPLPLTLAAWALRLARPYVPQLKDTAVDELILTLRDSGGAGQPLYIDVADEEEGEHVQIYIG